MATPARNTIVRARVNDHVKHRVEMVLGHLGLTMSDAINALFSQIAMRKALPFDVEIPNNLTQRTLRDSAMGKNIKRFDSIDDFFDDMGI